MRPPRWNVLSVDVEDYFHVSAFEAVFARERWDDIPPRIEYGLDRILDLMDRAGVHGTFYVLGWVANRRPDLVRRIAERGHEIGCHSHWHRLIYTMTEAAFRQDLRDALRAIEDAGGSRCATFRAPSFSVTRKSAWALRVLAEEGIRIDSSIYPVAHDRYGWPGTPRGPYRPLAHFPDFVEFPPTTVGLLGAAIPCAGGGYLRLYPLSLTRAALQRVNRVECRPAVVYVHPWELDPDQPRVTQAGRLVNLRHRINLARTAPRLERLLAEFSFATMSQVVERLGGAAALPLVPLPSTAAA